MTQLQKQTFFCTLPSFHLRPFKTRGTVVARTTQDETDIADKTTKTRTTQTCQALFGRHHPHLRRGTPSRNAKTISFVDRRRKGFGYFPDEANEFIQCR